MSVPSSSIVPLSVSTDSTFDLLQHQRRRHHSRQRRSPHVWPTARPPQRRHRTANRLERPRCAVQAPHQSLRVGRRSSLTRPRGRARSGSRRSSRGSSVMSASSAHPPAYRSCCHQAQVLPESAVPVAQNRKRQRDGASEVAARDFAPVPTLTTRALRPPYLFDYQTARLERRGVFFSFASEPPSPARLVFSIALLSGAKDATMTSALEAQPDDSPAPIKFLGLFPVQSRPPGFAQGKTLPEARSRNVVSKILFSWLTPILIVGYSRPVSSLPMRSYEAQPKSCSPRSHAL